MTPQVRVAIVKKTVTSIDKDGGKLEPLDMAGRIENGTVPLETAWKLLKG
jgi:hypothetical protein